MLRIIFVFSIFFLIFLVVLKQLPLLIKISKPLYRCLTLTDVIFYYYDNVYLDLLNTNFESTEAIEVSYEGYTILFKNIYEAGTELEKLITEALSYYDELGWIVDMDDDLKYGKKKLIEICHEIRMLRWKKQCGL